MITGQNRNQVLFVTDAIRQIFGIPGLIYIPWGKSQPYTAGDFSDIRFIPEEDDDNFLISELGTPVVGSIAFDGGNYNTYDRNGQVVKEKYGDYTLPYSCVVDFSRTSNTTKTEVMGSNGTVKEIFGKSDWKISIRGIAFNSRFDNQPDAHEQIETLVKWDNICDAIGVQGSVFRRKKIYSIVIEDFSIRPIVAQWNAIPFQIEAVSDEPIELYLK